MSNINDKISAELEARIGETHNEAIKFVNEKLEALGKNDDLDVYKIDEIAINIPYKKFSFKEYKDIIDDIPLKRSEYDEASEILRDLIKKYNEKARYSYHEAQNVLKKKFKEILFKESFTYKGKNSKTIFDAIFYKAYERGHSDGYTEVKAEFEELNDFFDSTFELTK